MDNRERILQCALELFYAKGYDAVGVQEIAQKAGITKPTLYYYFGNYKVYALLMAMFYSAKENEAYRAVKPLVKRFYSQIVHFFDAAEHELGNMNGRQEQFAIGFIGLINHYILLACDREGRPQQISEEKKRALVKQFMYGIYS